MDETRLAGFVMFARGLKGDEKSEAQTSLTRLFQGPVMWRPAAGGECSSLLI